MNQRELPFDQTVADRIHALLARCDRIRRGTDVGKPTKFDARGEAHARSVAERDRINHDTRIHK